MKKIILTIFLLCFLTQIIFSQRENNIQNEENIRFLWNVDFSTFLDNQEFAKSDYIKDQTLGGINIAPQAGILWQTGNAVFAGVNLLKEFGTQQVIDKATLIVYYKNKIFLKNNCTQSFYAGIFPREQLLSNYSDFLFWQPLTNYMPVIQGLYYKIEKKHNFANVWIDWTGKPSETINESFYAGLSAHKVLKSYFIDFQGYYFHFANTNPKNPDFNLCDNGQALLHAGYSMPQNRDRLFGCEISAGLMAGYENERKVDNQKLMPVGFVAFANFKIANFGMNNSLYAGDKRLHSYQKYDKQLYAANPFLQGNFYLQSEIFWQPFYSRTINGKIGLVTHISQGKVMFEQRFVLSVLLKNYDNRHFAKNIY
ncbi:MAG: hypothetical protein FWD66_07895 [Paludibacter sp.]|nr:hypothetical protein [Paludibacter sp.]